MHVLITHPQKEKTKFIRKGGEGDTCPVMLEKQANECHGLIGLSCLLVQAMYRREMQCL